MTDNLTNTEMSAGFDEPPVVMLYDGKCGFCSYWARRWKEKIGPQLEIIPLQDEERRPSDISVAELEEALHIVEPDGTIRRGAAAVFSALARRRLYAPGWWCYRFVPGFRWVSELFYRWVASHRMKVSRWTRWMRREDV